MNVSEKIIEMLNDNHKAKALLKAFNEAAAKANLTDEEYASTRKTTLMMAMTLVPETIELMAGEVYDEINAL